MKFQTLEQKHRKPAGTHPGFFSEYIFYKIITGLANVEPSTDTRAAADAYSYLTEVVIEYLSLCWAQSLPPSILPTAPGGNAHLFSFYRDEIQSLDKVKDLRKITNLATAEISLPAPLTIHLKIVF